MEFRRINGLPPYVFATINDLKAVARRDGRDVIDLGFGVLTVPAGKARLLLGDLLSREEHAAFVASLADDPDLATT